MHVDGDTPGASAGGRAQPGASPGEDVAYLTTWVITHSGVFCFPWSL